MKPLDPRLMKYARAARSYIALITIVGILTSIAVIAQTYLIAAAITPVIVNKAPFSAVAPAIAALAGVALIRALLVYIVNARAHRAAAAAITELREKTLTHAAKLGPRWLAKNGIDTVTLTTRGLDDLAPYFIAYLPQLLLSATVTPLVLLVIGILDPLSAVAAIVGIILVPIFMILIGKFTQDFSNRRLAAMQHLGRQLLDLIAGLATLKALGREHGPEKRIARIGERYTQTTMSTLRVAFLSGAVLEFIATLSVAIIAVNIGMRLVFGDVDLFTGLMVITLAPEVYLPLREVGKQFHASTDGVTAAEKVFQILETTPPASGHVTCPDLRETAIVFEGLTVGARHRFAPANLSATVQPGSICALEGPSGVGKTTTVMALLGQLSPDLGQVRIGDIPVDQIDIATLWAQTTWIPQNPAIIAGTIGENLGLGDNGTSKALATALAASGFDQVLSELPNGLDTRIGHGGIGLSVGQRQRLALTRALLQSTPLVILDEPTAHLDAHLEHQVIATISNLHAQGRTVILIAHREAVKSLADNLIELQARPMNAAEIAKYGIDGETGDDSTPVAMPSMLQMLDQEAKR